MKPLRLGLVGLHNHYHAIPFADELQKGVEGLELVTSATSVNGSSGILATSA